MCCILKINANSLLCPARDTTRPSVYGKEDDDGALITTTTPHPLKKMKK